MESPNPKQECQELTWEPVSFYALYVGFFNLGANFLDPGDSKLPLISVGFSVSATLFCLPPFP